MAARTMPIGEAARQSGIKVPTIRYYESIGLLPSPARSEGNRRQYDSDDVERLTFIKHARELGFGFGAIRTLFALQHHPDQSCETADQVARQRLAEVETRISTLTALKAELERMIAGGTHGRVDQCRVIEVLADHGQCRHHGRGRGANSTNM